MHDRRIDGKTVTFGNAGALFMNAMTWWDHDTSSIWSQPWGRALTGELKNVELYLLPSQLTTWGEWQTQYPHTQVMTNDVSRVGFRIGFDEDFVIGLILGEDTKAFYFRDVQSAGVINEQLGSTPIVIAAEGNTFHAFIRQIKTRVLTFTVVDGAIKDNETGSIWNFSRGLATDGPLRGQGLQPIPSTSAFNWAWEDFYPESEFYAPES